MLACVLKHIWHAIEAYCGAYWQTYWQACLEPVSKCIVHILSDTLASYFGKCIITHVGKHFVKLILASHFCNRDVDQLHFICSIIGSIICSIALVAEVLQFAIASVISFFIKWAGGCVAMRWGDARRYAKYHQSYMDI